MGKAAAVFLKDPEAAWIPAKLIKSNGKTADVEIPMYKDEQSTICDGGASASKWVEAEVDLSDYNKGVLPMQNVSESGTALCFADMVELPFLHEAGILYNLKQRHLDDFPYTRTGDIIIAVNPFQWFTHLYTEKVRGEYANTLVWEEHDEPDPRKLVEPHVYEVSSLSFKGLAFGGQDQSILVSGESGAGKTETVKIAMNHIASVQRGKTEASDEKFSDPVVDRVMESGPLLEAYGNAKTRRNDNSSRFGKYTQLQFDQGEPGANKFVTDKSQIKCKLVGSLCDVYLLEKNRVTYHDPMERTYHVMYQVIAADEDSKKMIWAEGLVGKRNEDFQYVGTSPCETIEGMTDAQHYQNVVKILDQIGVKGEDLKTLMRAICIVLQLGNLSFMKDPSDDDKSVVKDKSEFGLLANLMGVTEQDLIDCLTERTMKTRNESYKVPLNADVAKETADSFAKEIYSKTFLWLVRAINDATCAENNYEGTTKSFGIIGLLDIFGFESFVRNRFEQLCINYCNEKLQAKFTEDIFRSVQLEYEKEGIPLDEIKYDDNTDVLDLIEGKTGLLAMLNEECVRPKGEDQAFVTKALAANKKSPCLFANKTNRMGFGIHHYAGKVLYDAEGFVDANQETLPVDLMEAANLSSNEILAKHMTNDACSNFEKKKEEAPSGSGPRRAKSNLVSPTVWAKYKGQLASLMAMLGTTNSRYIRCIKPNKPKKPILMQHVTTIEQLRCAGVVAAVTLSRSAFPNRMDNSAVRFKFWQMWDKSKFPSEGTKDMDPAVKLAHDCRAILKCALAPLATNDKDGKPVTIFCVGKTRSYFKFGALEYLESHRAAGLDIHAVQMQKVARTFLARKKLVGSAKARREGVYIIQRFARRCKAKKDAMVEVEKMKVLQKKRLEKMAKEAEEKAFEAQLKAEIEDREYSATKEYKKYDQRIDEIGGQIREAEARFKERKDEAQERIEAARKEAEELRDKLENEIKPGAREPAKQAAAQKTKLEESGKLIAFLQKENKKLKSANDKAKKDMKKVKETNEKLVAANESAGQSFEMLNDQSKKMSNTTSDINKQIEKYKADNLTLRDELKKKQEFYNAEAQIRLQYQKTLAQILDVFQDNCKDADLVEDVVCIALECESEAKALLAAAEAAAPGM